MTSPSTSLNPPSVRPPAWNLPNLVLWGRYALVLLMLGLVVFARTLADIPPLYLLYGLCQLGSIYLVWLVIRQAPAGRIRWASLWFVASLLASVLRLIVRGGALALALDLTTPFIAGASSVLSFLSYACAIVAAAVFLPRSSAALGSTVRALVGSAVIGLAMLLLVVSIPLLREPLAFAGLDALLMPGFTLASLFAISVVVLRYGRRGGPLVMFLALGMCCLLISRLTLSIFLVLGADLNLVLFILLPLYAIQPVLFAHGIYRSIERPPQFTPPDVGRPNNDWLFWSMLPRASAAVALLVAIASGQVLLPLLLVLGVVWLGHELVSFVDAQRVQQSLQRAYAREREAAELIRFFSHELKGFAAELVGLTQLLRRQIDAEPATPDRSEQLTTLDLLDGSLIDIQDLLQQVLLLAEEGELAPRPREPVALAALLNEIRSSFIPGFQLDPAVLRVSAPPDLIVPGDPLFLGLAVRTATRNALESLRNNRHSGMWIELSARQEQDRVVIRISDTGPGFRAEHLALLQMALRGEHRMLDLAWSRKVGGFGLGLALIQRVAQLHGGHLELGNDRPHGARVELHLPMVE